jgi:stress-induced-phosphoprotein 1
MSDNKAKAEQLKNTGNTALKAGRLEEAITSYGDAIELDPDNHILYSNRSAAYVTARKYNDALKDAEKTIELKPDWPKGYSRVGAALVGMKRYSDAEEMYRKGLKFEPGNEQLMKGLEEAQKMKEAENNPFNSPDVLNRLLSNPKTAEYMKDPGFVNGIEELGRDHSALQKYLQDKRYIESLGVMLGIDIDTMYDSDIGGDEFIRKDNPLATEREEEKENDDPKTKESTKVPPEPMEVEVDDDSKKKALEEKEKGNASYKKKDFTAAHEHYDRAIQLDPENITILTNKAGNY